MKETGKAKIINLETHSSRDVVILGGGLAGLSAGYVLAEAGRGVIVFEGGPVVGGLSRTMNHGGFLFDLGGHRFLTKNKKVEQFFLSLLDGDVLEVPRKSKIYMFGRYFDYPVGPANALLGLGLPATFRIISDYCKEKIKNYLRPPEIVSLEDWIVSRFGRAMFDLYFKRYSEKVWGIDCQRISMEWVSQRIYGLSLWATIKNAFCRFSGRDLPTLADNFYYPPKGIGQISDKMRDAIAASHPVCTNTKVMRLEHRNNRITRVIARNCNHHYAVAGQEVISSIPMTSLVQMLHPAAPPEIVEAAAKLQYRDLVIVTIMLDREQVTDLTWMYLPGEDIPFGRIHEPKNWSPHMAPQGKTHIVAEYFCFINDATWSASNAELTAKTVAHLERLGFIDKDEVIDSCVLRIPKAYPVFEVGYQAHYEKIIDYLKTFDNLHIVGRGGKFKYYNMDHAMESGIETAEKICRTPAADVCHPASLWEAEEELAVYGKQQLA